MSTATGMAELAMGRVRFGIVAMLCVVTVVNYADRATLSIAGPVMAKDLGLTPIGMGYVFSAFGWSYVIAQIPGGWLLDRFGSKRVYFASIFTWSLFTLLQGGVWVFSAVTAVYALFALRFLVGAAEAPSFPANGRIVAAWFPAGERGTASALFNAAQYFATALFAPIMGWITVTYGWPAVFVVMGVLGIAVSAVWLKVVHSPGHHPRLGTLERDYMREGGALVDLDGPGAPPRGRRASTSGADFDAMLALLRDRMMVGIFVGQFCINAITYFFITWFPVYLVQQRHMGILNAGFVAAIPAICGFAGGVVGGTWSDALLRRGHSLTFARKLPLVLGMLVSMCMILCNYVEAQWLVVAIMAVSFFGKGIGALGWAVLSDTAPREIAGLSGGLFNMCGNVSSITTPIVIGYIIGITGSYDGALVFVGLNALAAAVSYLVIVKDIHRLELHRPQPAAH
ncbi:MFS transporter [Lichenibacterium ramalinae]|uniref:MFS transporter n=1 Tax=Lichenibacterium ramalinae TaxID=2316527 RepID=A0A4Q2R854_9HYPH|nr:MFS transporter [Lichenibacterium ramalinae]RYB02658.1 MFS transporter [Lichenibacterium ramalinae]